MDENALAAESEHGTDTALVGVSVVLVANQNDPSILNPDFLRYNEIVDATLQLRESAVSTPLFSRVVYEGDINVAAEPHRFVFEQRGSPLREDECAVPEIARRFVEVVSDIPYSAVGINPRSIRPSNDETKDSIADILTDGGKWMLFGEVMPAIQMKAFYSYQDRQITLDIGQAGAEGNDGSMSTGVLLQANIHRDIREGSQEQRIRTVSSILAAWKEDIADFNSLAAKFGSTGAS